MDREEMLLYIQDLEGENENLSEQNRLLIERIKALERNSHECIQ